MTNETKEQIDFVLFVSLLFKGSFGQLEHTEKQQARKRSAILSVAPN